jgi:hypothetical protein
MGDVEYNSEKFVIHSSKKYVLLIKYVCEFMIQTVRSLNLDQDRWISSVTVGMLNEDRL